MSALTPQERVRLALMCDAKAEQTEYCTTLTPWCDAASEAHDAVAEGFRALKQTAADWRAIAAELRGPQGQRLEGWVTQGDDADFYVDRLDYKPPPGWGPRRCILTILGTEEEQK